MFPIFLVTQKQTPSQQNELINSLETRDSLVRLEPWYPYPLVNGFDGVCQSYKEITIVSA